MSVLLLDRITLGLIHESPCRCLVKTALGFHLAAFASGRVHFDRGQQFRMGSRDSERFSSGNSSYRNRVAFRSSYDLVWGVRNFLEVLAEHHVLQVPIEAGLTPQPTIGVTSPLHSLIVPTEWLCSTISLDCRRRSVMMRRLHSGRLRRIYETAFPSPTVGRTRAGHRRIRRDARGDFGISDRNSAPHWRKREQCVLRCGKLNESIAVPGRLSRHPTGWRNPNFTSHWFERSSPLVRAAMTASDHDPSERGIAAPSI